MTIFDFLKKFLNRGKESLQTRVLVIEDNETEKAFTEKVLKRHHFPVLTAKNGGQGIALAIKEKIDVIILDYVLPDMDGLEVCRVLKENKTTQNIPVIFLTVVEDGYTLLECFEAGAATFLNKPISAKELIRQVEWVLRDREDQDSFD